MVSSSNITLQQHRVAAIGAHKDYLYKSAEIAKLFNYEKLIVEKTKQKYRMDNRESKDEDLNIPRAAINKFVKEVVPDIRISIETREIISKCCNEFIHIITSEANAICDEEQKKTIGSDHILKVFNRLGWSEYREVAKAVESNCKDRKRRQSTKLEHTGIPEEELLKQQQELIAKAKLEQAKEREDWARMQTMLSACLGGDNGNEAS